MATKTTYTPLVEININGLFYQVVTAATTEIIPGPTPEEIDASIPAEDWAWAESFADPDQRDLARADLVYAAERRLSLERRETDAGD